eukprot:TRINITY_DN66783_c0_g2_i1.p1 TRINITY_DN66783_c0_g2~~TRINITY_DN66783_c0_g2_i1.p1  ORF type:complete len:322 (-),score=22.74 TRINITY_DN66783_c0_g2_i1:107-1024(-)
MSATHPVSQLLKPHLRYTAFTSERMWNSMLGKDNCLESILGLEHYSQYALVRRGWENFDFCNQVMRRWLTNWQKDPTELDTVVLHEMKEVTDAVANYVESTLSRYYLGIADVTDIELQEYFRTLGTMIEHIIDLQPAFWLTPVVENVTAVFTHAVFAPESSRRNMYNYYGYIPNAPGRLRKPPLLNKLKDEITETDLLDCLPDIRTTILQMATCYVMSGLATNLAEDGTPLSPKETTDNSLLNMIDAPFIDKPANMYTQRFKEELAEISERMKVRAATATTAGQPYHDNGLDPAKVPHGFGVAHW